MVVLSVEAQAEESPLNLRDRQGGRGGPLGVDPSLGVRLFLDLGISKMVCSTTWIEIFNVSRHYDCVRGYFCASIIDVFYIS